VIAKGGLEYAAKVMNDYKDRALALLKDVPPSAAKESLEALIKYSIERKK
jgi:octaprenyl-diphosphate synthase